MRFTLGKAIISLVVLATLVACGGRLVARQFAVEDLLLTAEQLPPKWDLQGQYLTGCPSESPCVRRVVPLPLSPELAETWHRNGTEGAREEVFSEFALLADDGTVLIHGSEAVRLYRTPAIARSQYSSEVDIYQFSQSEVWQDVPPDAFATPYATRWRIGCSEGSTSFKEKCLYFAAYEEFLVEFSWIVRDTDSSANIDRDEFLEVVRTLDEEIGNRLYETDNMR